MQSDAGLGIEPAAAAGLRPQADRLAGLDRVLVVDHGAEQVAGDIKVFGWDLTAQAIAGIDAGWVAAVVQQDPATEGKVAVESLLKLKKGEKVPAIINVPVTIVTKANVDQYRSMFK